MNRLLMILVLSAQLLGCAYGSGEDEQKTKANENRQRLMGLYSPYVGTYQGKVDAQGTEVPVTLWMYIVERHIDKINPNGESHLLVPSLIVRYRREDILQPDVMMVGVINEASGEILAATEKNDFVMNVRFKFADSKISGEVVTTDGKFGNLSAERYRLEGYAPAEGIELDYRNRFYNAYFPYLGTYKGTATPLSGDPAYEVSFRIEYLLVGSTPTIAGYYDYKKLGFFNPRTTIELFRNPATLSMAVVGSNGVGFTFNGTMTGKEITGVATYNTLSNARIQAVKTTSPPRIQP